MRWSPAATLLVLCIATVPPASGSCPPPAESPAIERYSREDVRAGRVPGSAAIARAALRLNGNRVDVAVVTDAARDYLADDWPPLRPQARLMLVALGTGDVLWELIQAPHATARETYASDPRLGAPLGAAAALTGNENLAQRLYVGDHEGRVWRIDLPPLDRAADAATKWRLDLLADLSPNALTGSVRFRLAPDLVRSIDAAGTPFDGLVLTSEGASPVALYGNGTFFLRDYAVDPRQAGDTALSVIVRSDLTSPGATATATAGASTPAGTGAGWFAAFQNPAEVARYRPHTDGGRVFLVTAAPADQCDEPPLALTYVLNVPDGRPLADTLPGTVAGVGWLRGPRVDDRDILLPGRGIALPAITGEALARHRTRFRAAGVVARVTYWRDLLLDAE